MKSEIELKDILFSVIKNSELEKSIIANGGKLYMDQRPLNSEKEDIVIAIFDGLNGRIQSATIDVNIYVPDIDRDNDKIENTVRMRELSRLAIDLLEVYNGGDYRFEIEKQKCFKVEGKSEHFINNRLNLSITNF